MQALIANRSAHVASFIGMILALGVPAAGGDGASDHSLLLDRRVMVLGDSITQGGTYVSMLAFELLRAFPLQHVDIISIGLSSETTSGLTERIHPGARPCVLTRLDRALAEVNPELVIACYGMNDGIYLPLDPAREAAFHAGIQALVSRCLTANATVILLTPPVFDPTPYGTNVSQDDTGPGYTKPYARYDDVLTAYASWETGLTLPHLVVVDLHREMAEFLARKRRDQPGFILASDGIHPGDLGHLVMASAILRATGTVCPADPEAELGRLHADPLYSQVATLRSLRSERWLPWSRGLSDRGPVDAVEAAVAVGMATIDRLRQPAGPGTGSH